MESAALDPPAPAGRKSRLRRWTRRGIKTVVILYLLACVVLFFIQNRLIFPGSWMHGVEARNIDVPGGQVLKLRTPDGHRVTALFGAAFMENGVPRVDAASRPTILFFYGNGDCIATSLDTFEDFRRLGANVLVPEYVGYPMSGGKPSEAGMYAAADAAYAELQSRTDVDPHQIIVVGRSIGSGAAVDLASRRPVAGLATFSAFTSMDAMAHKVLPMFPTSLFLRTHLDNLKKMPDVQCPVWLAHGTRDDLVPFSMMAELAKKAKGSATVVEVPGANHNDIFEVGGEPLLARFGQFIEAVHANAANAPAATQPRPEP